MKNWLILVLAVGIFVTACQPKDTSKEINEPDFQFEKIVCSRGPFYPANLEIYKNGDFIYSGEILGEKEVEYGAFEYYFIGKVSDTDLAYFGKLIQKLENKAKNDAPFAIDSPWYGMRVYYKNGYREYKGQEEQEWEELINSYNKVELKKLKGRRTFETMDMVLPPLPDVSNQPQIEEIKE